MAQQTEKEIKAINATWTVKEIKPNIVTCMCTIHVVFLKQHCTFGSECVSVNVALEAYMYF